MHLGPDSPPALDVALATKLIGAWRRLHRVFKPIEDKIETARGKVVKLLVDAGVTEVKTKWGTIKLRTKDVTDWEGLARKLLAPDVVDGMKASFTKQSAPFVCALPSWGRE